VKKVPLPFDEAQSQLIEGTNGSVLQILVHEIRSW